MNTESAVLKSNPQWATESSARRKQEEEDLRSRDDDEDKERLACARDPWARLD